MKTLDEKQFLEKKAISIIKAKFKDQIHIYK